MAKVGESWGEPWPQDKLAPLEKVRERLRSTPGALWETQRRVINGKLRTVYKNLPGNVRKLWELVTMLYANRPYLSYWNDTLTYAQVDEQVKALAYYLRRECMVRKSDRVAIMARNVPEFVIAHWAIHLVGAVCVPINAQGTKDLLEFCIQDVDARVVICDAERYHALAADGGLQRLLSSRGAVLENGVLGAGKRASLQNIIVVPRARPEKGKHSDKVLDAERAWRNEPSCVDYDDIVDASKEAASKEWAEHKGANIEQADPEDICTLLYTSGTTGRPKAVVSTQRQYLSSIGAATSARALPVLRRGEPLPGPANPQNDVQLRLLICVPLFHSAALQSSMVIGTVAGSHICLLPRWNAHLAVETINRHKVMGLVGVGFMLRELALTGAKMPSLVTVAHGGASTSSNLPNELKKAVPSATMGQGYGATETQGSAISISADDYYARPSSCGLPVVGMQAIIVNMETLTEVPIGETGEIWLRGPTVALGYWNRPKATAESFTPDGWYRTGDLGYRDEQGFFYIVDRAKDMIIRGGENISANSVEDAVYLCEPRILECAAVAAPHPRLGETVALICVPVNRGVGINEEELRRKLQAKLPSYAVPEHIWIRDEPLDRNATGKILKIELRKQVARRSKL